MSEYMGHIEIETPWGNSGGVVKRVEDVELMAHTGVGWIEAGSYTLESRPGNGYHGERVYYHNPTTGETFNSLGMPNKGFDAVEKEVPAMLEAAHAFNKPLIINIAPVSDEPIEETKELVERAMSTNADGVLLNASCPNVVLDDGGRHELLSHNAAMLKRVLVGCRNIVESYDKKLSIRVAPFKSYKQAVPVMYAVRQSGVIDTVFTPNTFGGYKPKLGKGEYVLQVRNNIGGRSGPATAESSVEQAMWTLNALSNSGIDVVSSCGISTGFELARRKKLGAIAGAGTTLYYESAQEGWNEATDRLLRQYAEAA
jgi:dihydroorotate dehydrogenase